MTHLEIIKKLIGEIRPVGETNTDNARFENLKTLCNLVDELVGEIDGVGYDFQNNHQFSMKRASDYAKKFMTDTLGINQ